VSIYNAQANRRVIVFVFLCAIVLSEAAAGQSAEVNALDSGLQLRTLTALQRFEASSGEEYTIGDGDEIDIQVIGRPELSGTQAVGPDGRITLPLSGSLEIRNTTREAAARAIADTLQRYYTSLDVTVRVTKYGSNRILVLGHVAHPGVLYFENAPTLLEALTKNPALSSKGAESESLLPRRCAIFRGKDQVVWIDLKSMLDDGGSMADIRLRRDDVLYVPDEQDDLVSVLGEVQHPGMVKLEPKTTLLEVLAMSGGLTSAAGSAKIEIVRPSSGTAREVTFPDLLNPHKTVEISLQRGDVIYVQKGTMAKFEYALQQLAPLSSIMLFSSTLLTSVH
jgi:polysaccharide export outer membrane protein